MEPLLGLPTDDASVRRALSSIPFGFTTVPDKSAGDVFTEAMWDTYIRDNLNKGAMRAIGDSTLGSAASSITFSSITTDFAALMLVIQARGDTAALSTSLLGRFNGDTAGNYYSEQQYANGTTNTAAEGIASTSLIWGEIAAASAVANAAGMAVLFIPNYASTVFQKTVYGLNTFRTGNGTGAVVVRHTGGAWASTAAINSVSALAGGGNFIVGTRATLFGVAN